jgi:hypothetical protein
MNRSELWDARRFWGFVFLERSGVKSEMQISFETFKRKVILENEKTWRLSYSLHIHHLEISDPFRPTNGLFGHLKVTPFGKSV